jgi:hypothetical protein
MMLVLVTVLCVFLATTVRKAVRQKEAVDAIRRSHGAVKYDWEVGADPQPSSRSLLRDLFGCDYFDSVVEVDLAMKIGHIVMEGVEEEHYHLDLMQLQKLPELRTLSLCDSTVTDLRFLTGLTRMEVLWLECSSLRDLTGLKGMKNLKRLGIDRTPEVYDLSPLAGLDSIEYLSILFSPTRDVSPLMGLKNPKELVLYTPNAPAEQIEQLRIALPNCRIIYAEFTSALFPSEMNPPPADSMRLQWCWINDGGGELEM